MPMNSKRQRRRAWAYAITFILVCALVSAQVYISDTRARRIGEASESLLANSRLRESATQLLATIDIAQAARRRLLLTGDPRDLARIETARHEVAKRLPLFIAAGQEAGLAAEALQAQAHGAEWLSQLNRAASIEAARETSVALASSESAPGDDAFTASIEALHFSAGESQNAVLAEIDETADRLRLWTYALAISLLMFAALWWRWSRKLRMQNERDRLNREQLRRRASELSDLLRHVLEAREEEKANVARELHDELGSSLTAVNMDLAWVRQRLQDPVIAQRVQRAVDVLTSTVRRKRRITSDLRPAALDNLGLAAAVESYAAEFSERIGIPIEVEVPDELPELRKGCPITIFRILQEALMNVSLHAAATSIKVRLHQSNATIVLEVVDDGEGFTPDVNKPGAHGILTMRERADHAGGTLEILAGPGGRGSKVETRLPCVAAPGK